LDRGFFERQLFGDARAAGAHLIMRLKSIVKVRVTGHLSGRRFVELPEWSLNYYLTSASRARGTLFDLDVIWGTGKTAVSLRLVGFAHKANNIRWYLTTVSRNQLSARQIVEAYRLRWLIELLFRELKQATDFGRSFTANPHAVQVLTYGAMLAHVLVRSLRIQAALANDVPLEQLRPLACLHVARAFAHEIVDALASTSRAAWSRVTGRVAEVLLVIARELRPSRSRGRIALQLGAVGG
jgi:IS4 transposase